jgi:hypothetical protein
MIYTEVEMYLILIPASLEVISKFKYIVDDIIINSFIPCLSTIQYQIYSISKAIEIVSRYIKVKDIARGLFNGISL